MLAAQGIVQFFGAEIESEPDWIDARLEGAPATYFSSNGIKMAYEFQVVSASGEPRGYVAIRAYKGAGPLLAATTEGYTLAHELKQFAIENGIEMNSMKPHNYRFIRRTDSWTCVLGLRQWPEHVDLKKNPVIYQDGWYLLGFLEENVEPIYHVDQSYIDSLYIRGTPEAAEDDEAWTYFINERK